jgi:hypothetical protein
MLSWLYVSNRLCTSSRRLPGLQGTEMGMHHQKLQGTHLMASQLTRYLVHSL